MERAFMWGKPQYHSKSEFSRCKVPRLRVDLERWTSTKRMEEEEVKVKVSTQKEHLEEIEQVEQAEASLEEK
jgi:hypothetical protein